MKKTTYILVWLLAPLSVFAQVQVTKAYIQQYKEIAMKEMKRTGIPASITLAQAIVESSSGESNLAKKFNNHFGIKCKLDWKGETTYQDDDTKKECFRVYSDAMSSFKDHSDFLKNRPNYASLFELDPVDDTAWAYGLKKAGYATASDYPKKLLKVIDDYELSQYNFPELANEKEEDPKATEPVASTVALNNIKGIEATNNYNSKNATFKSISNLPKDTITETTTQDFKKTNSNKNSQDTLQQKKPVYPINQRFKINQVPAIWGQAGRSFLEIANTYHIALYKLYLFNDLPETDLIEQDQIIFLSEKKKESRKKIHVIKPGESLYTISQSEAIQLSLLKAYNPNLQAGSLQEGAIVYLFNMPKESTPTIKAPIENKKPILKKKK